MFRGFGRAFSGAAMAACLLISGCLEAVADDDCGPDALGVSRTITLTPDSPAPYDLLKPGEVILTFDDGPDVFRTKPVLNELAKECTKATFFLLGKKARDFPKIARELRKAGHSVGSHSLNHANLAGMELDAAMANAESGRSAVEDALGEPARLFRFPFVATTPELSAAVRDAGMIDVTVTADGADWTNNSPEDATAMILEKLEQRDRRGMILLHDPFDRSAARVRILLESLKEHGYRVVALEQPQG